MTMNTGSVTLPVSVSWAQLEPLFSTPCDGANCDVKADEHKDKILFRIVHAIGKEAKPLSDFEEMGE